MSTAPPSGQRESVEIIGDGGSVGRSVGTVLRRFRPWIVLGALLLIVVIAGLIGAPRETLSPLSPSNPAPEGSMAVAEVLRQQGVDVIEASSLTEAQDALAAQDGTLLLHDPDGWLDNDQLSSLKDLSARLVLIEPGLTILDVLAPGIRSAGVVPAEAAGPLEARCSAEDPSTAGTITSGGQVYRGELTCFPAGNPEQSGAASGSYAATGALDVVVLGNGAILSNGVIEDNGNAALVLRTLGNSASLVWYQPTPQDLAVTDQPVNPLNLLPEFVNPLMLWLLLTALAAIVWRARRLGPLVEEPMPVVVRAAETAEGRARLYQDAGSINRAAANLRAATLSRIALMLRIPASSPASAVVEAAARRTGRSTQELDLLLHTHTPLSDADLVRWSQELDTLEKEINQR
ncbi:DUF4350 domain-containing protein [Arthrobacter sp. H5]|uniref:DUF4350 domain-containing protein n=1 Tax=Arthrobacter sp. H5 TaxID=1267973 RepID=UPI00138AC466|nr:DUF4350 domain-containing protein [Arthrobacter sp. H5]